MNIADRIQHLRKSKGFSQEELADKIGVSRQAVSKWESEQSTPDLEKIIVMSDFFGVTTDYILKGIEPVKDKEVIAPVTLTKGWIAPYPISKIHTLIFGIVFSISLVVSYLFVKKRTHSTQ